MKGRIRQRSPGTRQVSYDVGRDALGKRKTKAVTARGTKADAQRKLREPLTALDQGDAPEPADITLSQFGPALVQALESRVGQNLGPRTVNLVHVILSGSFRYAARLELIHRNPVSLVSPPPAKRKDVMPPDILAVRHALELARGDGHDLYPAMHLIASYTGLRRGEALGLLWEHVDLVRGFLLVEGSLVQSPRHGGQRRPSATSAGRRAVDLDAGIVEVLRQHRARQAELQESMGEAYDDQGRVFADPYGGWASPQRLLKTVKEYGNRAGQPSISVRSLRPFHASLLLQSGQNVVVVSKRLGHSAVSIMTDVYAHSLPGWQKQAAEAFAAAMEGG